MAHQEIEVEQEREIDSFNQEVAEAQALIDSGMAWRLEGSIGRHCMALIESGYCTLGPVGHHDAYGNYVPGRDEVQPGTKGSLEYSQMMMERED